LHTFDVHIILGREFDTAPLNNLRFCLPSNWWNIKFVLSWIPISHMIGTPS